MGIPRSDHPIDHFPPQMNLTPLSVTPYTRTHLCLFLISLLSPQRPIGAAPALLPRRLPRRPDATEVAPPFATTPAPPPGSSNIVPPVLALIQPRRHLRSTNPSHLLPFPHASSVFPRAAARPSRLPRPTPDSLPAPASLPRRLPSPVRLPSPRPLPLGRWGEHRLAKGVTVSGHGSASRLP
jgi:hypothetical protein